MKRLWRQRRVNDRLLIEHARYLTFPCTPYCNTDSPSFPAPFSVPLAATITALFTAMKWSMGESTIVGSVLALLGSGKRTRGTPPACPQAAPRAFGPVELLLSKAPVKVQKKRPSGQALCV